MKFVSTLIVFSLFISHLGFAKTQVQKQWVQVKAVSPDRVQIQVCTEFECLIIGKMEGYSSEEIKGIHEINSLKIQAMKSQKWIVTIGLAVVGSYLFRIGKVLTSITLGVITYPPIRGFDERIQARETFQAMPRVLSHDNFELDPTQFIQLVQGLRDAVQSYDNCIEASVSMGGPADLNYCHTGQVPGQPVLVWGP